MTRKKTFSSKDFHQTYAKIQNQVPERLIHAAVEQVGEHESFSKERQHPVFIIDLPSKNVSMTIGGLLPEQVTSKHRHSYETILYVVEGTGWTDIEDRRIHWKAGDAVYIPMWAWHRHGNVSKEIAAKYIAAENAPQMQNLGVALREEEGRDF